MNMNVFPLVHVDPDPEYLIFSNRHEMRSVDLSNHNYAALVSGLHNTVALDFYYNKSLIFWTDVADDKIFRGKLQGNGMSLFPVKLCGFCFMVLFNSVYNLNGISYILWKIQEKNFTHGGRMWLSFIQNILQNAFLFKFHCNNINQLHNEITSVVVIIPQWCTVLSVHAVSSCIYI